MFGKDATYALIIFFLSTLAFAPIESQPHFSENEITNDTGYVTLHWSIEGEKEVTVYKVSSSRTKPIYRGNGDRVFISGLKNGTYDFQLKNAEASEIYDKLKLRVKHQSLAGSIVLFLAGLVTFIFLIIAIINFNFRSNHGELN